MNLNLKVQRGTYERLDEGLIVPDDGGRYIRIKHWEEIGIGDNDEAYPEIIHKSAGLLTKDPDGREYDYVEMPDEWMWFLWRTYDWSSQYLLPRGRIEEFYQRPGNDRIFARTTPGSLTYVYVDMVEAHRAFTEAGSPEGGFRDIVTGRNLSAPKNVQWLFRPTGGALCRIKRILGAYYELEALDALKPPPVFNEYVEKPWLRFWCTQSDKFNGATRFPQVKNVNEIHGLPPAGIASPLLSLGGSIKMLRTSCVELDPGAPYSPYKSV